MSGPGSSVAAWREYAAASTGTPVEQWGRFSRDEIVELLDGEAAVSSGVDEAEQDGVQPDEGPGQHAVDELPAASAGRPEWMAWTDEGWKPERELDRRRR